ncbi:MAG: sugar ABC transporter permease [Spirochaetaceae bacterium 4572_7]|nr:MAG: sugar ABC transporter permease [Spirochaetaceae bacterium 4572_7]
MKNKQLLVGIISVVLGLFAGAILMVLIGENPITGYMYLFKGGLMSIERVGNTLATATPIILTGLSVAFAFKTGLFNIGASGQMLIGGLCATAVALTVVLPKPLMIILIIIVAIIGGFKGMSLETESRSIPDFASLKVDWLSNLFNGSYINLGLFIALITVVIIWIVLNKTVIGFQMKAAGFNRDAALYSGMNVNKNIVLSMVIAGALAGLAGATYYVGYSSNMQIGVLPTAGFDGIAVALLGANNPFGAAAGAIFFGLLHSGKGFMSAMTNIPPEIGDTIIATIIYFAAVSILIEKFLTFLSKRIKERK